MATASEPMEAEKDGEWRQNGEDVWQAHVAKLTSSHSHAKHSSNISEENIATAAAG